MIKFASLAVLVLVSTVACTSDGTNGRAQAGEAGVTVWLSSTKARAYVRRTFKREIYATGIECRVDATGELLVRFHTRRVIEGAKPFHKWQFVITDPGGLEAAIAAIPLRDRPDLRYRIISRDRAGRVAECAVAYR